MKFSIRGRVAFCGLMTVVAAGISLGERSARAEDTAIIAVPLTGDRDFKIDYQCNPVSGEAVFSSYSYPAKNNYQLWTNERRIRDARRMAQSDCYARWAEAQGETGSVAGNDSEQIDYLVNHPVRRRHALRTCAERDAHPFDRDFFPAKLTFWRERCAAIRAKAAEYEALADQRALETHGQLEQIRAGEPAAGDRAIRTGSTTVETPAEAAELANAKPTVEYTHKTAVITHSGRSAEEIRGKVAEVREACQAFFADPTNPQWDSGDMAEFKARCSLLAKYSKQSSRSGQQAGCSEVGSVHRANAWKYSRLGNAAAASSDAAERAKAAGYYAQAESELKLAREELMSKGPAGSCSQSAGQGQKTLTNSELNDIIGDGDDESSSASSAASGAR